MNETLERLVASEIRPLGLELFELKVGGAKSRPILDVRVDREDGQKVTVDNCAAASRAIENRLDAAGFGGWLASALLVGGRLLRGFRIRSRPSMARRRPVRRRRSNCRWLRCRTPPTGSLPLFGTGTSRSNTSWPRIFWSAPFTQAVKELIWGSTRI